MKIDEQTPPLALQHGLAGAQNPDQIDDAILWGKRWRSLQFAEDGTLGHSAGGDVAFWKLETRAGRLRLSLFGNADDADPRLVFTRTNRHRWHGEENLHGMELRHMSRIHPEPAQLHAQPANARRLPRILARRFKAGIEVVCSGFGIGDQIVALYASAGAASAGLEVTFYPRHGKWLMRASHPRLTIAPEIPITCGEGIRSGRFIDLNADYTHQTRFATSRTHWYASAIAPGLAPARPAQVDTRVMERRLDSPRYVVVSPCGAWPLRDWPALNWTRLITLLGEMGYDVIAIGSEREAERLAAICGPTSAFWVTGQSPEWDIDLLLEAAVVIGNDSGIAHVGGLLGVPTIAIHSIFSPQLLWGCTDVQGVTPNTDCVFCHHQAERGFRSICSLGCHALGTVSVDRVMETVKRVARHDGAIRTSTPTLA